MTEGKHSWGQDLTKMGVGIEVVVCCCVFSLQVTFRSLPYYLALRKTWKSQPTASSTQKQSP